MVRKKKKGSSRTLWPFLNCSDEKNVEPIHQTRDELRNRAVQCLPVAQALLTAGSSGVRTVVSYQEQCKRDTLSMTVRGNKPLLLHEHASKLATRHVEPNKTIQVAANRVPTASLRRRIPELFKCLAPASVFVQFPSSTGTGTKQTSNLSPRRWRSA